MIDGPPGRLLIADGHRLHRMALGAAFDHEPDFTVVGRVGNDRAAVTAAVTRDADIVLVAAGLPTAGGVDVCARIKHEGRRRAVVVLDEQPRPRVLIEAMQADADGYITRDVSYAGFMTALRAVARGEVSVPRSLQGALVKGLKESQREREQASELLARLTRREREVIELLADGLNHHAVAEVLCISPQTVRTHIQNSLAKLDVGSRLEAAAVARRYRHERADGGAALS